MTAEVEHPPALVSRLSRGQWPDITRSPLAIALLAYLILVVLFLPRYMSFYYKDEIAYVAAAERYAHGEFANAPNSLWGPLISWLIAIAMSLGASSIIAARTVGVTIGATALWSSQRLAKTLELPRGLQILFLLTLVPYFVRYALFGATDDLPLTALLTLYFSIIFQSRYPELRMSGAVCGLLGGFAYYAKGFGFGFFLMHFTACNAVHWFSRGTPAVRRDVLRHFATGILVFAALSVVWIGALHEKYGGISIGITGKYNYEMRSPTSLGRPTEFIGFVAPPPATAVSIWEDPAYLYDLPQARACCLKHWSPLESGNALKHQLILFKLNLGRTLMSLLSYSPFTLAVLFAGLAYCFAPLWPRAGRRKKRNDSPSRSSALEEIRATLVAKRRLTPALVVLTILLYPVPYTLVFSDERFFWPILILFLGLGLSLLEAFYREYALNRRIRFGLAAVFAASFLLFPTYKLATGQKDRSSLASIAGQLKSSPLAGVRFASNSDYGASMVVGYYIKAKYYGSAIPGMSDENVAKDLKSKKIQYYFMWGAPAEPHPGMTLMKLFQSGFRRLAIYRVDP